MQITIAHDRTLLTSERSYSKFSGMTTSTTADEGLRATRRSLRPLALACGGSFLAFLDVTIANLAIPDIAADFHVGVGSLTWVVTLYTIFFAALLAPAGGYADAIGRRRLFTIGVSTFTIGSLLAALAPTFSVLLVARSVQGVGAALLIPASLAFVLADTVPERRTAAIGLWSASASLAAAVGPALSGVIVDSFDWRSLFCINIPIGIWLVAAARGHRQAPGTGARIPDPWGTLLLTAAIGLAVLAATEGQRWGWSSPETLGSFAAAAIAGAGALRLAGRHPRPAIDTSLWRHRTYARANVVSVLFGIGLYASLLLGVLFLVQVWDYSELRAGLGMTPGAVASAIVGVGVGRASRRPSARALVFIGSTVTACAFAAMALMLTTEPHFWTVWFPGGLAMGAGIGATSVGVSSAATLAVTPQKFASATGLNIAARQVGGAIGVAVLGVILAAGFADGIDPFHAVYWLITTTALLAAVIGLSLVLPDADPGVSSPTTGESA